MVNGKKRICSAVLCLLLLASSFLFTQAGASQAVTENTAVPAEDYGLAENIEDGAILHAWCWSFDTIRENLENIARAGFTSVQTSPINACKVGDNGGMQLMGNGKWYYHYQPTDYVIGNYQLGTKADFEALCDEAETYGINIIVDVVANHMSSDYSVIADYIKELPGGAFHPMNGISSYNNRQDFTQNSLLSLWDFNTQNPNVQQLILNYLKECVAAGADGFRYDAAKHIELPEDDPSFASDFWPVVLENGAQFQYGEILQGGADWIDVYANYMHVTASNYGGIIRNAAASANYEVSRIENYNANVPQNKLVTWVESHDNYCGDGSWSMLDEQQVKEAWSVITARSGGTPLFFSRPHGSSTTNQWGDNLIGAAGSDLFKDPDVAAVNSFRNTMAGLDETLRNPGGNTGVIMIERANLGAVIVNATDQAASVETETKLDNGIYYDKVTNEPYEVQNGTLTGTIDAHQILVLTGEKSQVKPYVSISQQGGNFRESLSLTVRAVNAESASYTVGGTEVPFEEEAQFEIGADMRDGDTVTVTVRAENAFGVTEETYTFTKLSYPVLEGETVVYFDNQYDWESVYIYMYTENPHTDNGWPGVPMQSIGSNMYAAVLPAEYENSRVMFSNGNGAQYPASGEPGLVIEKGQWMVYNGVWEDYKQYITPQEEIKMGDVTGDGAINIEDVLALQSYIAKMRTFTEEQITAGDVTYSGAIEIEDVLRIQQYIAHMIDGFDRPL